MRKIINNNSLSSTAETVVEIKVIPVTPEATSTPEFPPITVSPPVTLTDIIKNEKTE